jgi:RND family efflux transporter MFP subunit
MTGCIVFGCSSGSKKPDQSQQKENTAVIRIKVIVERAARRDIQQRRLFTGILEPLKKADLSPGAPGRIRTIAVDIGDRVAQGQVLARMDDANLVALTANFDNLKSQFERTKRLYENSAASKVQFETVQAQYLSTKRQLEQVTENTIIKAPFAGIITGKAAEEGEMYSPQMGAAGGNAGLIQLTQLDPLKLDLNVDEMSVAFLHKGMQVQLKVKALRDTVITGTVLWVNPAAQALSRTFQVRVVIPNATNAMKAGYFVETSVVLAQKKNVLAVPVSAVNGNRVFTIEQDSIAIARQVTAGWNTDEYVEILSGIPEGALVIISGNKAIPDSTIVITEEAAGRRRE